MDSRPHGIQMTLPGGGNQNTSEPSVGRAYLLHDVDLIYT